MSTQINKMQKINLFGKNRVISGQKTDRIKIGPT